VLAADDEEARHVVLLVLDVGLEDIETVELARESRSDGGGMRVAHLGDVLGGARRVGPFALREAELLDRLAALAERGPLAVDVLHAVERSAFQSQELMAHAMEVLAG